MSATKIANVPAPSRSSSSIEVTTIAMCSHYHQITRFAHPFGLDVIPHTHSLEEINLEANQRCHARNEQGESRQDNPRGKNLVSILRVEVVDN